MPAGVLGVGGVAHPNGRLDGRIGRCPIRVEIESGISRVDCIAIVVQWRCPDGADPRVQIPLVLPFPCHPTVLDIQHPSRRPGQIALGPAVKLKGA